MISMHQIINQINRLIRGKKDVQLHEVVATQFIVFGSSSDLYEFDFTTFEFFGFLNGSSTTSFSLFRLFKQTLQF